MAITAIKTTDNTIITKFFQGILYNVTCMPPFATATLNALIFRIGKCPNQ